jgi:ATP-binding cassette, subfamily B, bacterial PglK
MLISAFAEVVTLGAVLPFLGILVAPEKVFNYPIITNIAQTFEINTADQLVLPFTIAFATAALAAGAIRILLLWINTRLTCSIGADLSLEAYRRTLYQSYQVHVTRNTSEVISNISTKINEVVFGVLLPLLTLVSSTAMLIVVMLALITINPMVAFVAAIIFGGSYAYISLISRRLLYRNSQSKAEKQTQVIKALQEGLGGIRDVLLDGTQPVYCNIFSQADYQLRRAQSSNMFIGSCPRHIMEALGMVMITILAYSMNKQVGGIVAAVPVLGALALGAQRVLPALQQVYNCWASISGNYASLADIISMLDQTLPAEQLQPKLAPLNLKHSIRFKAVRFSYTGEAPWVLDDFNLTIAKGTRVGFVGSSGSGKSTLLDLLMGLLTPTEGEILLDGKSISGKYIRALQQTIAHVPQNIYLADATLAENIAFGVPLDNINFDRVQQAARQAQIADFIESSPEGYKAYVGERGIRLSGGQRQRIGIARALYKQARILVFDEATSALDNATEQSVINAIEGLNRDLTILIIAHRLTTVRSCDTIVELDHGQVVAHGTYEQLLEHSPTFQKMVGVRTLNWEL